jgi:CRP-like cAMP-binding protein
MPTVKFRAGETIISEGEDGNTAFLIVSGSVDVSVGKEANAQTIATLNAGEVFGELCLIEPGPRSATVKAVTHVECVPMACDDFIPLMQNEPQRAILYMKSLVRRLREIHNLLSVAPAEVLGRRIQQSLQVVLAGLEEREALSGADLKALGHELGMLLQIDRVQIATGEIDKAEQVLQYMLRPNIEECLNLWFGKSEQHGPGHLEPVRRGRGPGLPGAVRPLGVECRAPAPAGGAGDHARPVQPQHVPRHAPDVRL